MQQNLSYGRIQFIFTTVTDIWTATKILWGYLILEETIHVPYGLELALSRWIGKCQENRLVASATEIRP